MADAQKPLRTAVFTVGVDGSRIRTLIAPITGVENPITSIILRKPKHREIMQFGDPASLILMDGAAMPHEDIGVVEKYINALSGDQTGAKILPALLDQLDYRDSLALKDAVLDFFKQAEVSTTSAEPPKS